MKPLSSKHIQVLPTRWNRATENSEESGTSEARKTQYRGHYRSYANSAVVLVILWTKNIHMIPLFPSNRTVLWHKPRVQSQFTAPTQQACFPTCADGDNVSLLFARTGKPIYKKPNRKHIQAFLEGKIL